MTKRPELRISDVDPKIKEWVERLARRENRSVARQAEWMLMEYKRLIDNKK